jgi:hypothetical protein
VGTSLLTGHPLEDDATGEQKSEVKLEKFEGLRPGLTVYIQGTILFLLFHLSQEKALGYLKTVMSGSEDPVQEMGDIFQLIVLEMLRKLCKIEPA